MDLEFLPDGVHHFADKLHIVHTEASLGWGGQEIRILEETQCMIARGHKVEIWAAAGSGILAEAGQRALPHRALPIGRKSLGGMIAMRRALASARPDVVNSHSSTDAWLVALALMTLRDAPPMVRTRHISSRIPNNFPTRWLYNHATRHIVTTGERLREILAVLQHPQAKETTKLKSIAKLVTGALAGEDPAREELA